MDPVMARLIDIALDPGLEPRDALVAIRDVLDRGGLSAKQAVELTVKPWEEALQDIVAAAGGEVVIEGDVWEGELVADDDGETPVSASTRDSELRRQPAVDYLGSDRPQGTVDPAPGGQPCPACPHTAQTPLAAPSPARPRSAHPTSASARRNRPTWLPTGWPAWCAAWTTSHPAPRPTYRSRKALRCFKWVT